MRVFIFTLLISLKKTNISFTMTSFLIIITYARRYATPSYDMHIKTYSRYMEKYAILPLDYARLKVI